MSIPGLTNPARPDPDPVGAVGAQRLPTLYGCAIGRALATVRVRSGMPVCTLAALLDRAPADVLDLEDGRAAVSVALLHLWCHRLRVSATSVLGWAARVAAPEVRGWVIDLRTAAELPTLDTQPHVRKLAAWARRLRDADPHRSFLTLPEPEIRALAVRWSIPVDTLVDLLADLTPLALVPWQESEQDQAHGGAAQSYNARPRHHTTRSAQAGPVANDADDQQRGSQEAASLADTPAAVGSPLADRVGLLLRRQRLAHERDLASLARALHVSLSHICRLELARTEIRLSFLARWCAELGVRPSDILRMAEDEANPAPTGPTPPVVAAPAAPDDLALPAWTVPLYQTRRARSGAARTGLRCAHREVQTRVERRAGQPADITRCVTCGQPVPIRATPVTARRAARCPVPPDVVVLDEGVITR